MATRSSGGTRSPRRKAPSKALRKIAPEHGDAIRIVPLHPAAGAEIVGPAAAPQLTYRSGPLMTSVEVFTIFWGAAWNSAPQNAMIAEINQFFDFILTSALIDQLAEYDVANYKITHGKRTGTTTLTSPALGKTVQDSAIQKMLQDEIAMNLPGSTNRRPGSPSFSAFPKASANTLYFIYFPPGVKVVQGGAGSCTSFCGYHNDINGEIFYAAMPYPGCSGCIGGLQPIDALTSTSSHELCEAVTDPIPGQGWYDDENGEIGDICAWQTKKIGNYTVQLEWSNKANRCV